MEENIYYMRRLRCSVNKPAIVFEATGDPEKYEMKLKFSFTPINKNRIFHEYEVTANRQDLDFLKSSLTSEKNLDKKKGINWHGEHLKILRLNKAIVNEDIPRKCVMRIMWHGVARGVKISPVKIDPDEKIIPIEIRLSGNDTDCLIMMIERVIDMAQEINYKAPIISKKISEELMGTMGPLLSKKIIEDLLPVLRQKQPSS